MAAKHYNPAANVLKIAGSKIEGFGPDAAVSFKYNAPASAWEVGIDGIGTRTVIADDSATATITLAQTSSANAHFEALVRLRSDGHNAADVGAFYYLDVADGKEYSAQAAFVLERPEYAFSKEASTRVWKLGLDKLTISAVDMGA